MIPLMSDGHDMVAHFQNKETNISIEGQSHHQCILVQLAENPTVTLTVQHGHLSLKASQTFEAVAFHGCVVGFHLLNLRFQVPVPHIDQILEVRELVFEVQEFQGQQIGPL